MIITRKQGTRLYKNEHVQLDGNACIDHWEKRGEQGDSFFFTPDQSNPHTVESWLHRGTAQLMSDGCFEFVAKPMLRSESTLIKKLPHGRLSRTKDGFIQLTLKIRLDEQVDMAEVFREEAELAAVAISKYNIIDQ